ncbi:type II toxin-antitoxin system Phd/YefM family antitoxin [Herbidospora mongoliensis]|uniref:type II toxin-antitoxin system Phd/YefM family antitoxin n=1 Tax=Herbidospora mongoliensis TaxID=688067 RepID=UPI00082B7386|nr:type II toxin-antitoxin system Phd/YefM family antitoxin [Herbidospora mongoliensis]
MTWQLQEAEQQFSEVVRRAHLEGPLVVTRNGEEVAVVVGIQEYHRLKGAAPDLKSYLLEDPAWDDDIEFPRDRSLPREIDF